MLALDKKEGQDWAGQKITNGGGGDVRDSGGPVSNRSKGGHGRPGADK